MKNNPTAIFNKQAGHFNEEAKIKFETYRFYIQCFVDIINHRFSNNENLIIEVSNQSKRLQGFRGFDKSWVERFLKNAWNTEYILKLNLSDDPELAKINNQWLPIQAYYSIYSAGEALSYLLDGNKARSHRACLRKLNNYLATVNLPPWNLMYKDPIGKKSNDHKPHNFPTNLRIPHNLERSGTTPIQMACKCLKAEHKNRVNSEFKKGQGVRKYAFDPGYTSILNFLYRLRLKSNYEGIEVFLAEASDDVIINFGKNLSFLSYKTLALFEIVIMRKICKNEILSIMDEYLSVNPNALGLKERRELISRL